MGSTIRGIAMRERKNFWSTVWSVLIISHYITGTSSYTSPWGWECRTDPVDGNLEPTQVSRCIKVQKSSSSSSTGLNTCKITCGPYGALWPQPTGPLELGSEVAFFLPQNIGQVTTTCPGAVRHYLDMAFDIFVDNI